MNFLTEEQTRKAWEDFTGNHNQALHHVYNLGVEHGRQQVAEEHPLWPEPITERRPTAEDADPNGLVQVQCIHGHWTGTWWHEVASAGWQHTCNWQPKPPTLNQLALADLKANSTAYPGLPWDNIRRALEAQP